MTLSEHVWVFLCFDAVNQPSKGRWIHSKEEHLVYLCLILGRWKSHCIQFCGEINVTCNSNVSLPWLVFFMAMSSKYLAFYAHFCSANVTIFLCFMFKLSLPLHLNSNDYNLSFFQTPAAIHRQLLYKLWLWEKLWIGSFFLTRQTRCVINLDTINNNDNRYNW